MARNRKGCISERRGLYECNGMHVTRYGPRVVLIVPDERQFFRACDQSFILIVHAVDLALKQSQQLVFFIVHSHSFVF